MIRRPCVAGQFYPADPDVLDEAVAGFIGTEDAEEEALAVIAPHAGYVYSGHVAGAAYSAVTVPDDVILIGPNHTGYGRKVSLWSEGSWEMPFGSMEVNSELAERLLESVLFSEDTEAHLGEHSLEVQLPFIHMKNENARIVPITVMHATAAECEQLGTAIAGAIRAYGHEVLIIVSSDMNHYEPDTVTREKDLRAIDRVLSLDARGLLEVTATEDITMCGVIPAAIAIFACQKLGAREASLVEYATSGDAGGDYSQVVGYAGIVIR